MGNRTLPALCARLLKEGLPADTPAYLVERASTPEETIIRGVVGDLPEKVRNKTLLGPVMVMIGRALAGDAP